MKAFEARPENYCIIEAYREYQFALSALLTGHYRHAFSSLRLTFEMLLHCVYFSGHEVKFKQWIMGQRDLTWRTLVDEDKGIFSASFVRAFNSDLMDDRKQFKALAEAAYRECSEFVHGNPERSIRLTGELSFKKDILAEWEGTMQNMRLSALFCYLYRYGGNLSDGQKIILAAPMTDAFGHMPAVQSSFKGF
ncbi:MAG: hypothetical protein WA908_00605 [Pontixanthobacter sp.]